MNHQTNFDETWPRNSRIVRCVVRIDVLIIDINSGGMCKRLTIRICLHVLLCLILFFESVHRTLKYRNIVPGELSKSFGVISKSFGDVSKSFRANVLPTLACRQITLTPKTHLIFRAL